MITPHVVSWQWNVYRNAHQDRRNLLIHAVTVSLFAAGIGLAASGLVRGALLPVVAGAASALLAVVAQGRGHRLEREAPQPFRSPVDALVRLVVEQFVTFPRFVLSGGFSQAWHDGQKRTPAARTRTACRETSRDGTTA